ncbi:UDP-N-acetylglucosamine 2-epimerase [candidate division WOR-1 bacterium RIFOXYB2_FULL_42_35]|uniref:UDP-N-acetylglucosamine 2-epimerase n=1 Tax=candidate division WOR-1 bacterium RIFOXYC2_FULL_41_25 TaxID=1802586 RepID=A0A1F4TM87_UNCSA|nr:MAG: UDP-N-acetylglucosamine 2-epimerase [candidate division WOR-1 bacterium RIFOXYA2_FULL_41_14]OGC24117.1 MAG: UDP-N-acetylglucosamine 2-epimerase [candidate division WOR-1 bacterium RIFOXYB2_FULL_42_35]OGC33804.1 MAG: UDP-N-acetylglucosamine 2-epimerase [candidate division WOR-1 bacterium RIFOXYC2_FULL_41_25]OGC43699.1 MAG: UDP-N-acetylglucosamine 2-epimerase [candidate division WOR-1 bacterium RIFOXYD2_FULL_41_8]
MANKRKKIISVVGARPNFMKLAPVARELDRHKNKLRHLILHTGQHYDKNMSKIFFEELDIPKPQINLGVGSGGHGQQTGMIMAKFEKVCYKEKPDLVLVYGDINSTMAAALVSRKLHIPVAHIEAGFRAHDLTIPEEVNRLVTDVVSDYLFSISAEETKNLRLEGIGRDKIFEVGDIMADSLLFFKRKALTLQTWASLGLKQRGYALLTLHRPSNVDDRNVLKNIFAAIKKIAQKIPVVFPVHPRTRKMIQQFDLDGVKNIKFIPPLGYLDFLSLLMSSGFVLTDSGGVQLEASVLNLPCLTLRKVVERKSTLASGTNVLVGNNASKIVGEAGKIIIDFGKRKPVKKLPWIWDGKTAQRIVRILIEKKL